MSDRVFAVLSWVLLAGQSWLWFGMFYVLGLSESTCILPPGVVYPGCHLNWYFIPYMITSVSAIILNFGWAVACLSKEINS